jgi:hypothetical protein
VHTETVSLEDYSFMVALMPDGAVRLFIPPNSPVHDPDVRVTRAKVADALVSMAGRVRLGEIVGP